MRRRERYLSRFLAGLCRSEHFKADPFFQEWLRCNEAKAWTKVCKEAEKQKFLRGMENIQSEQGRVPATMISNSNVFCSKMTDFVDSYQILYNEVIECAKEINERSQALASTMHSM